MRASMFLAIFGLGACASCKTRESEQIQAFKAEIAIKNKRLSLLEEAVGKQRALLEDVRRKEKESALSNRVELSAREQRINDLRRQLDNSLSLLVKTEVMAREAIEHQREEFNRKLERLQEQVSWLEKELAQKK